MDKRMWWVVVVALVALVALLAAACGGADTGALGGAGDGATADAGGDTTGDTPQGATTQTPGGRETVAAAGAGTSSCEPGETDGDLVLYNWSEYIDPELLTAFTEETGATVTEDFYPSNEELLARLQEGASGYDVIVPSDYMVAIMAEEQLMLPLDHDAIPNMGNLAEEWRDLPFDPGNTYSVPYQWGTTGLAVDTEVVPEPERTWGLVFDPEMSADYAGRISLLDDPRETMGAALYYLGHDVNTTDEAQLEEAAQLLSDTTDRLAAFESNAYDDLLMQGETAVAHGYSGNLFNAFALADDPERYTYILPEEGATRWVDNMAIAANAPHPCTAHAFIDFLLDAENGAQLSEWNLYGSPNAASIELLPEDITNDPNIYPPDDELEELSLIEDTGDAEILFNDYFTQAKS